LTESKLCLPVLMVITSATLLLAGCSSDAASSEQADEDDANATSIDEAVSASSCAPASATGAVASKHRAMLDTIAFTEGTARSCGQDGYNTGYAYHCFSSCARHPRTVWSGGGYSSSAAGRYQFLTRTWETMGMASFSPRNQDIAAVELIGRRGVTLPTSRALTATEFSNAMRKISLEWASLPFSPYGQPTVSLARARDRYCDFAGC
jgi:muramidase (phage lysozyme)